MPYNTAIQMAVRTLSALDPDAVCARAGVAYDGGEYVIPWFNEKKRLGDGSETERILWMHYLISEGVGAPTGRLVAYRELKGAGFYELAFNARVIRPLVKRFGANPALLTQTAVLLDGRPERMGDAAATIWPLPRLSVTYIVWGGDDELPPDGMILFDSAASGWLPAEDLTVLAALGTYRLVKTAGAA